MVDRKGTSLKEHKWENENPVGGQCCGDLGETNCYTDCFQFIIMVQRLCITWGQKFVIDMQKGINSDVIVVRLQNRDLL